jgi:uncharacterized protein DUF5916
MELATATVGAALLLAGATLSAVHDDRPIVPAPLIVSVLHLQDAPAGAAPGTRGGTASPAVRPIDGPPPPVAPETLARDAAGGVTVRAVRLTEPLKLDGMLDERIYQTVPALSGFSQQLPNEGAPATERTEAWLFYDERNIYVSARLWASVPESQWVANEMQRDSFQLINNDYFSIVLDTFYDRRNGVAFMVNPIGGFFDYEVTDEGNPNSDWNPIWDVRPGRFEGGWTVEARIPFKSLRFRPGSSQVWGVQLGRRIRWKNEMTYLTRVPISAGPGEFRVSAAATLVGLEMPQSSRRFDIKPYAIGSLATDQTRTPRTSNQLDGDAGVDIKYGVTQNLTADFTYNTDFAQVEVDEQQVNLTQFPLFFPEKREFFLEGRGIFDFGRPGGGGEGGFRIGRGSGTLLGGSDVPTLFFSRQIGLNNGLAVPIVGGGRLTGKAGKFTIGALNIQADDAPSAGTVATNFTVLRVKRDVLRRSRIGGIFTGRSVSTVGPGSNEVYGVDAAFSFFDNVNFNGYYAKTRTPGLTGDDHSYQAAFSYNGDLYRFQLDHLLIGDNFNPEVGFMRRDNIRRTFTSAQYRPRPKSIAAVRQFTFGASLDYIKNGAGPVETGVAQARFETEFQNSDRFVVDVQQSHELLRQPFPLTPAVTIPIGEYDFRDVFVAYSMGEQRPVSGTWSVERGEYFNGHLRAVTYQRARIALTPQLSVQPGLSINRIELPETAVTLKLVTSRVTYTVTPRMFVSGLMQYNSSTSSLSANLRFRWEYRPGSEFFLVYNDLRDTSQRGTLLLENRSFVVKLTRQFRL